MMLSDLAPGMRFVLLESAGPLTGTLVELHEGRAVVDFDGTPQLYDFERGDHTWGRIITSGKRRTSITPQCLVRVITG